MKVEKIKLKNPNNKYMREYSRAVEAGLKAWKEGKLDNVVSVERKKQLKQVD